MKEQLENELIAAIQPFLVPDYEEDAKMHILMVLSGYEVRKEETSLTVYEGDVNENMLNRFLMAKIARGLSRRTVTYYRNSIKMTLEMIGKPYNEITPEDIRVYLALRVQRDGVSKTTANNERRNLSAFYCWLQKEEILLKNPMNKVEAIKETKKKKKAFEQIELERMRYSCKNSMETALIEVMISTWARVTEIAEMQIQEISGTHITVHGKGDKERDVYLSPKAQLALQKYLNERSDTNPYVFPRAKYAGDIAKYGRKKNEWWRDPEMVGEGHRNASTIEGTIRRIGKDAGVVNAHPHRFRRTGATMALRSGMPLLTVSKLLGHENIGTTQIYLDISDKELEQAHEKWVQ